MGKSLSEMSLEELWRLFPIYLTEHRECWKAWYEEETALLWEYLPKAERISHIGSTAIASIWAKPIIDILVELSPGSDMENAVKTLCQAGWLCMNQSGNRVSLNKGYTEQGFAERVFHLHLRYAGDNDELYFRDYLIDHPDDAKAYEKLKLELWKQYEHDRDGYTEAKKEFVARRTRQAKELYGARYGAKQTGPDDPTKAR